MYVQQDERAKAPECPAAARKSANGDIEVKMLVPGFTKDNLDIKVTKKAVRVYIGKDEDDTFGLVATKYFNEFPITNVEKLDNTEGKVAAKLENGILTLTLPVAEEYRPMDVTIE